MSTVEFSVAGIPWSGLNGGSAFETTVREQDQHLGGVVETDEVLVADHMTRGDAGLGPWRGAGWTGETVIVLWQFVVLRSTGPPSWSCSSLPTQIESSGHGAPTTIRRRSPSGCRLRARSAAPTCRR